MKSFLEYHTKDKFSTLDGMFISVSGVLFGKEMFVLACVTALTGLFVSAVVTVLVERMR